MLCTSAGGYIKPDALLYSCIVCPVRCCLSGKMRPLGLLLLFLTCQLATPTPISDQNDGAGFHSGHQRYYRSAGVGDTIRDWFREIKSRIMGKIQEWFGNDGPGPSLSPQDFFNIDKTIESRVSSYPGLFVDLWNEFKPDGDSDEWDVRSLLPNLPFPSIPGIDWKPNKPGVTGPLTTTPKIELTTSRQQTIQPVTQTASTVTTTESIVTSAEPTPSTTQSIAISTEPIATEEILTSRETVEMEDSEPADSAVSIESTLTSTKVITTPTESTVPSDDSTVISVEPGLTSIESTVTTIEPIITTESTVMSTEEVIISTTESPATSTEPILPLFNKRIEENEIDKPSTKKPRPASAEVIM